MQVGKTYNRNLENCIPFTRHIPVQEAMQRHAETSRKGTAVICFAPIVQSVTTRQAELALFVLVMQQKWHNQSLLEVL